MQSSMQHFHAPQALSIRISCIFMMTIHLASSQYGLYLDLPGDYCSARPGGPCCDGRIDSCSLPILGTLCYCDQFCDRTNNPDCCPDYWNACLNITEPPQSLTAHSCKIESENIEIPHATSHTINCNECKCNNGNLTCESDACLVDVDVLRRIQTNSRIYGWTAANYSDFWGRKLNDGLMMRTGTLPPDELSLRMHPIKLNYDVSSLPRRFDTRQKWKGSAGAIRDQGWCGSSWAFSTISVAQDRLAIASNGEEAIDWSTQNLLSCNRKGQQACNGGHVERAWGFLRKYGVVPEVCYPYQSGSSSKSESCAIPKNPTLQSINCETKEFPKGRTELYTTEPAYRIASKEGDIMWELMTNGPVQALMKVYQDFFLYKSGIYSREALSSNGKFSIHSVKLTGWGEEQTFRGTTEKYWVAANSWGASWGENGYFRIRRGTNESDIEQFILTVRAHLAEESNLITRRRNRPTRRIEGNRRF